MWLLSTDRAELHEFHTSPEKIPGRYAILSHVRDREEPSFQDMQELQVLCANNPRALTSRNAFGPVMSHNPRDHASPKIRNACIVAQKQGCQWLWVDTCCMIARDIEGMGSEAVLAGTLYRYYAAATVCLAYLADVPRDDAHAQFPASRWHWDAWTLPELVAPRAILFFSREWAYIGTKHELATILERACRVPARVLTRQDSLDKYSVAERMAWAAGR